MIGSVVVGILVILILWWMFKKKQTETEIDSEFIEDKDAYDKAVEESEDFEKKYFEAVENGEKFQQFLVLGGQQDCSLIRSLLAADGIPTYIENENVNRMYGGVATSVTSVFAIKLFILVKDYDKAYEIVCDYAKSKQEDFKEQRSNSSNIAKTTAAVVTGLFFAPYPVNAEQKGMGITILPKVYID